MSLDLNTMAEIAQPLDEWCEFCGLHLAYEKTDEGTAICPDCAKQVREAMAKYEAEGRQVAAMQRRSNGSVVSAGAAKAKAKRRAKRKRTKR